MSKTTSVLFQSSQNAIVWFLKTWHTAHTLMFKSLGLIRNYVFERSLSSKAAFFIINIVILWNIITIWNNCFILSYIFKWDLFLWRNAIFSSSLHLLQLSVSNNPLEIILIWYSLIKSSISKPSLIKKKKIPLWIQSSKEYNLSEMVIF